MLTSGGLEACLPRGVWGHAYLHVGGSGGMLT